MTKTKRRLIQMASICLVLVMLWGISIQPTYADYGGWGPVTHIGKYYFKFHYLYNRLYVSTKKNKGYRKTTVNSSQFASNGKEVMYVGRSNGRYYIKSYVISSRKTKKVKKLPKSDYWAVSAARGHYLWLESNYNLYRYNINTRKMVLVKEKVYLTHLKSSFYVCTDYENASTIRVKYNLYEEFDEEDGYDGYYSINGRKVEICQATKDGKLKLIKDLGVIYNFGTSPENNLLHEGRLNKVYYTTGEGHEVRCVDYNGKNDKEVVTFKDAVVSHTLGKWCYFIEDGEHYRYFYNTGEIDDDTDRNGNEWWEIWTED